MPTDHRECPECGSILTEAVSTEFHRDMIERVRICNDCPAQWVVSYGHPIVRDVELIE